MSDRNQRKVRIGNVVGTACDKTITVVVQRQIAHPKYEKIVRMNKKYHVHDENNECNVGDTVEIMEVRPLSKTKRWRLTGIIEKAK